MLDSASKAFFHLVAKSRTLKSLASRYGMRKPTSFARRFIAGESVAEAIDAARAVEGRGMHITLDLLGESVTNLDEADAATREYLAVIDAIVQSGIERNLSLKLTQLGLDVDKASAVDNLRKILERVQPAGFFVRVDMENSPYTDVTLEIVETLWQHGYREIGVVLQSMLYRSEQDLARMNALGVRLRPHVKTSKCPEVVKRQLATGAQGITVSTLKEAERFFAEGIDDIFYAVAIAPGKLDHAMDLTLRGCRLTLLVESIDAARELGIAATPAWLFGDSFVVPGVQPRELFERVVSRLRARTGDTPAEPGP